MKAHAFWSFQFKGHPFLDRTLCLWLTQELEVHTRLILWASEIVRKEGMTVELVPADAMHYRSREMQNSSARLNHLSCRVP